jgi:hypothetical protein
MVMKQIGVAIAAILALGAGGSSCVILIGGNKDYVEVDGGGPSGGADAGHDTGGAGGTGGTGGASSSSGTGGGTTCDVQHAGGGTCEYFPGIACGCSGSKKCSVTNENTGTSGCVFAGSTPDYGKCSTDGDCLAGSWCNHATSSCQPICTQNADCTSGGSCLPASQADGVTPIPDLKVCAAHCDLVTAKPCGAGLTCVYLVQAQEFECAGSQGVGDGSACVADPDCKAGLGCFKIGTNAQCISWCTPASTIGEFGSQGCNGPEACYSLNPHVKSGAVEYGYCM